MHNPAKQYTCLHCNTILFSWFSTPTASPELPHFKTFLLISEIFTVDYALEEAVRPNSSTETKLWYSCLRRILLPMPLLWDQVAPLLPWEDQKSFHASEKGPRRSEKRRSLLIFPGRHLFLLDTRHSVNDISQIALQFVSLSPKKIEHEKNALIELRRFKASWVACLQSQSNKAN